MGGGRLARRPCLRRPDQLDHAPIDGMVLDQQHTRRVIAFDRMALAARGPELV